jgi:hypothetical protein
MISLAICSFAESDDELDELDDPLDSLELAGLESSEK